MIAFFPELLRDELLYSGFARYRCALGLRDQRRVLTAIFGNDGGRAVVELPGRLAALVERLPPGAPYTVARLLADHTMLPYYRPYKRPDQVARAEHALVTGYANNVWGILGLRASTVRSPATLRFCAACVHADRDAYGTAYWHRAHQLPGVHVCHRHLTLLTASVVGRLDGTARTAFFALEEVVVTPPSVAASAAASTTPSPTDIATPETGTATASVRVHAAQVARDTAWLLATDASGPGLDVIRARYRDALRDAGLMRGRHHVRLPALRQQLTAYYGAGFLETLGCATADGLVEDWVARAMRSVDTTLHPLHHILIAHFLGIPQDALLCTVSTVNREPCAALDTAPLAGAALGNRVEAPVCEAPDLAVRCLSGNSSANDAHDVAAQSMAERGAEAVSPSIKRATIRLIPGQKLGERTPEWEAELRRLVGDDTVTLREAARRLRVETVTVKRHAWRLGVWRASWRMHQHILPKTRMREQVAAHRKSARTEYTRVRRAHPKMSRSALEALAPQAVQWLRRRDKAWFDARQPSRQYGTPRTPRVDWAARDAKLATRIDGAAAELRAVERPKRVTATKILCRLDCADLQSKLDRLPLTRAQLDQHAESGDAFAERRLEWTAARYRAELEAPGLSSLLERAALRARDRQRLRARAIELVAELAQYRPAVTQATTG